MVYAFNQTGIDPKLVQLIILTQGHLDHVGNAAYAKKLCGARVLCHQSFAESLEKGEIEPAVAQNFVARLLNFLTGLSGSKFDGVKPDIVINGEYDLKEHGIIGKLIYTPGHSESSISIILENGEALIGDMLREERSGKVGLGMFYEDQKALVESLEEAAAHGPKVIYLSHSTYIDHLALTNAIETFKVVAET